MLPPANSPDAASALAALLASAGIREADLEESFVRSSGPGGQNVNKTASCVCLVHKPTGLSVKCQTSRHQGMNRLLARQQLVRKLEAARQARADAERARQEKLRRQRRPRSRAAKQRMLADKSRRSDRKATRRRPELD